MCKVRMISARAALNRPPHLGGGRSDTAAEEGAGVEDALCAIALLLDAQQHSGGERGQPDSRDWPRDGSLSRRSLGGCGMRPEVSRV